jgi:hypothetical protein
VWARRTTITKGSTRMATRVTNFNYTSLRGAHGRSAKCRDRVVKIRLAVFHKAEGYHAGFRLAQGLQHGQKSGVRHKTLIRCFR